MFEIEGWSVYDLRLECMSLKARVLHLSPQYIILKKWYECSVILFMYTVYCGILPKPFIGTMKQKAISSGRTTRQATLLCIILRKSQIMNSL